LGVSVDDSYVFHSPDSTTLDFADVDLVKVGLLLSTRDTFIGSTQNRPYYLADTLVNVAGTDPGPSYPDDKRIRLAYNLSVKVRNRNR